MIYRLVDDDSPNQPSRQYLLTIVNTSQSIKISSECFPSCPRSIQQRWALASVLGGSVAHGILWFLLHHILSQYPSAFSCSLSRKDWVTWVEYVLRNNQMMQWFWESTWHVTIQLAVPFVSRSSSSSLLPPLCLPPFLILAKFSPSPFPCQQNSDSDTVCCRVEFDFGRIVFFPLSVGSSFYAKILFFDNGFDINRPIYQKYSYITTGKPTSNRTLL